MADVVKANTSFLGQVPIIGDLIKGLAFDAYKSASDKEKAAKDNLISAVNDAQAEANNNRQSFEEFQDALEKFAADVDAAADALADAGKYVKNVVTYAGGGSPVYSLRDISGGSGNIHNLNHLLGFAGGAWNIPMDNYLARLHAGEMVLTADQARRYRAMAASGGNTYNDSAAIYIDKYNQYSGADADGLLQMMQAMQRRQRMGYGLG